MSTPNQTKQNYRVEFKFHDPPPLNLVEKEYARLDELKAQGIFISLKLKPDKSGGILQMKGESKDEVQEAVESLALYSFANWNIFYQ